MEVSHAMRSSTTKYVGNSASLGEKAIEPNESLSVMRAKRSHDDGWGVSSQCSIGVNVPCAICVPVLMLPRRTQCLQAKLKTTSENCSCRVRTKLHTLQNVTHDASYAGLLYKSLQ
eukprot:6248797-Amphidinium_carterae.1